jgi:hypothetical protein
MSFPKDLRGKTFLDKIHTLGWHEISEVWFICAGINPARLLRSARFSLDP